MATGAQAAYVDALRMLGRRELSEAQVRQRLARRDHDADAIEAAIARLTDERSLDDARVAAAIARLETDVKHHGRRRVRRQIERAGVATTTARRAVDDAFADIDDDALLQASLAKRLRGRDRIADEREAQRLYRYLVGQGFESDPVLRALGALRRRRE
jgi:regulatory protein